MLACYALLTPGGKDDAEIISESLELKNARKGGARGLWTCGQRVDHGPTGESKTPNRALAA